MVAHSNQHSVTHTQWAPKGGFHPLIQETQNYVVKSNCELVTGVLLAMTGVSPIDMAFPLKTPVVEIVI